MGNLVQAFKMEHPDTLPLSIGILPAAWMKYGKELQRLTDQYPQFFGGRQVDLEHIRDNMASLITMTGQYLLPNVWIVMCLKLWQHWIANQSCAGIDVLTAILILTVRFLIFLMGL